MPTVTALSDRLKNLAGRVLPLRSGGLAGRPPGRVVVLGNQKSGSTAVAALLAHCIDRPLGYDLLYRTKVALGDLLAEDPSLPALVESRPEKFAATVLKDNDFTFLHPQVARAFPDAAFVFVVRDPRQNIRSILNRVELPGDLDGLSPEQYAELRSRLPGWHSILTGSSFGASPGHYIDDLAARWVRAGEVYLRARSNLRLVRYEDFDAAKGPQIRRLATDLGFTPVQDVAEVQDRQFQPRGDRSVTPEEFFGPENLARIDRVCGPVMAELGYRPST